MIAQEISRENRSALIMFLEVHCCTCLKSQHFFFFECSVVFVTIRPWEGKPCGNADNICSCFLRGSWREFQLRPAFLGWGPSSWIASHGLVQTGIIVRVWPVSVLKTLLFYNNYRLGRSYPKVHTKALHPLHSPSCRDNITTIAGYHN